ncbi:hypothetical protein HWV62_27466 [Athelia sp. TMB]|nr:hypothetical protein HWV62_27466 [Athelia sp. TMB]
MTKRKDRQSSSEVEIVEGSVDASPSKVVTSKTTPFTSPVKSTTQTTTRPTVVKSGQRKSVLQQLKEAELTSDDDPMAGEPEAEEVTDPHFFDEPEGPSPPEEPMDENSESYWKDVDSVHHSDLETIEKEATVAEDPYVARTKRKGNAVILSAEEDFSDEDVVESKAAACKSTGMGGSSSRSAILCLPLPDVFRDLSAQPVASRGSGTASKPASAVVKTAAEEKYIYSEDLEVGVRGKQSPSVCEVYNRAELDKGIRYNNPVNLKVYTFRSWSDSPHAGLPTFLAWKEQCPNISLTSKLIEFEGNGHIRNASRTDPSTLAAIPLPGNNFILIEAGTRDAIVQFTMVLFLTENTRLHDLVEVLARSGVVEWERMQVILCMAHSITYANVNMRAGSLQFCTAKTMGYGSSPAKNPNMFLRKPSVLAGGKTSRSPFIGPKATVTGNAIIPILDARGRKFNLQDDLLKLNSVLPEYEGEIPQGSCVWVGYTSTRYKTKEKGPGLNFNLMWVVLMGTP